MVDLFVVRVYEIKQDLVSFALNPFRYLLGVAAFIGFADLLKLCRYLGLESKFMRLSIEM